MSKTFYVVGNGDDVEGSEKDFQSFVGMFLVTADTVEELDIAAKADGKGPYAAYEVTIKGVTENENTVG